MKLAASSPESVKLKLEFASASVAVSVATAVSPSSTAKLAAEVITGVSSFRSLIVRVIT